MFAPPPVQLSREEIEKRRIARQKLNGIATAAAASISGPTSPLHGADSQSPRSAKKRHLFANPPTATNVSKPILISPISPRRPSASPSIASKAVSKDLSVLNILPPGFAERPRPAPLPPVRQGHPLPFAIVPAVLPPRSALLRESDKAHNQEVPPPIPEKSPRRNDEHLAAPGELPVTRLSTVPVTKPTSLLQTPELLASQTPVLHDCRVVPATDEREKKSDATQSHGFSKSARGHVRVRSQDSDTLGQAETAHKLEAGDDESRLLSVKDARIRKTSPARKRSRNIASNRPIVRELDLTRESTSSSVPGTASLVSMKTAHRETRPAIITKRLDLLPPPLDVPTRALPATPTSIIGTPVEICQDAETTPKLLRKITASHEKKKNKLTKVSKNSATTQAPAHLDLEMSPNRLSAILEDVVNSASPRSCSGATTPPSATQIHLRGGSIVTVTPPELNPWYRTVYVQGPIKLPTPATMPRKGSVASLEPFQEVIDQVYQQALNIPRRRSDEQVTDEVCSFFDDFGFAPIVFEGDMFGQTASGSQDISTEDLPAPHEPQLVSTLQSELTTLSMDKDVVKASEEPATETAQQKLGEEIAIGFSSKYPSGISARSSMVEGKSQDSKAEETQLKHLPTDMYTPPPVDNEETVRAKGVARIGSNAADAARPSVSSQDSTTRQQTPISTPSHSPALEASRVAVGQPTQDQGFDWDDEDGVEEPDISSARVTPLAMSKKFGSAGRSSKEARNPVARMRRLYATASTIL